MEREVAIKRSKLRKLLIPSYRGAIFMILIFLAPIYQSLRTHNGGKIILETSVGHKFK